MNDRFDPERESAADTIADLRDQIRGMLKIGLDTEAELTSLRSLLADFAATNKLLADELTQAMDRLTEAERLLAVLCENHQYAPHVRAYLRDLKATDSASGEGEK